MTNHVCVEVKGRANPIDLVGLIALLAVTGALLDLATGLPHLPTRVPGLGTTSTILQGSEIPLSALAYLLTSAALILWTWVVVSLVSRLVVRSIDMVTDGAAWLRSLRVASDWLTLPFVRRIVDGAIVAYLVVNLVGRAPRASAAPLTPPILVTATIGRGQPIAPSVSARPNVPDGSSRTVEYRVQPGDTLWSIAERFYGTGEEFPRLVTANAGRRMADGRVFTRAGVLRPGWVLEVPLPGRAASEVSGQTIYVVESGDTLRGIAARFLGDEMRWPEIFELNRGNAKLANGRTVTDPDLIWPGLRLRLPASSPTEATTHPHVTTTEPVLHPRPTSPTVVPSVRDVGPPTPTVILPTPVPVSIPPQRPVSNHHAAEPPPQDSSHLLAGAAGGLVASATAAAVLWSRHRRRIGRPAPRDQLPQTGFIEGDLTRALIYRSQTGDDEPALRATVQVLRYLRVHDVNGVGVLMAQRGQRHLLLTLLAGSVERQRVVALASNLGNILGGTGQASCTPDYDVLLRIVGPTRVGVLAPAIEQIDRAPVLVPVGVQPSREILYANWRELGHVLIAGVPGGGVEVILTSVIAALAARRRPRDLRVWMVVGSTALPDRLRMLPHQEAEAVAPWDEGHLRGILARFRSELGRRVRIAPTDRSVTVPSGEEWVLVFSEVTEIPRDPEIFTTLEMLGKDGPSVGLRMIVATIRPSGLDDSTLLYFKTRLVLAMEHEEESVILLGQPDAADLGRSELLAQIEGRRPVRVRGFKISDDNLERLVETMATVHPRQTPTTMGDDLPETGDDRDGSGESHDGRLAAAVPDVNEGAADAEALVDGLTSEISADDHGRRPSTGTEAPVTDDGAHLPPPSTTEAPVGDVETDDRRANPRLAPSSVSANDVRSNGHIATLPAGIDPADKTVIAVEAPIRIRCFGDLQVMSGNRALSCEGKTGAQYKPWEILVFLAAQPAGVVPKERLISTLWPDVDVERGAHRLGVYLARLRDLLREQVPGLSADVVRSDRDGTCRLNTQLVWSDVHAFGALGRAASHAPPDELREAYEQARALYRGDLLTDSTYAWVHERDDSGLSLQERYREQYHRITTHLAQVCCRDGHPDQAVPLYRSLLQMDPTREEVVRDLYRCYAQLNDRVAILREDRRLRQVLREAYTNPEDADDEPDIYQPEPETRAVFDEALAKLESKTAKNGSAPRIRGVG